MKPKQTHGYIENRVVVAKGEGKWGRESGGGKVGEGWVESLRSVDANIMYRMDKQQSPIV